MSTIIGSARIDERGKISGGAAGDQTGKEVATEKFYVSSKGWYVLRAKDSSHANKIAAAMKKYCNDNNVGYDQSNRLAILKYTGKSKTECDCSSLVRRCIIDATGKDVGNFTTATEKTVLTKSGLFTSIGKYTDKVMLLPGDIIVTCTKGHTAVIISTDIKSVTSSYVKGCTYHTTGSLYCRVEADKKSKATYIYASGTAVTCQDIKIVNGNTWMKTSRGWSAAIYDGKVRIK